jgi:hypothetical protein
LFDELVTEFGLTVEDGVIKYATYDDTYVMSTMYNTIYIRKNNLMKKFVGTMDEARLRIGECLRKIKADKTEKRIYQLGQDFD